MKQYTTTDQYIASFPEHIQELLRQIRATIKEFTPSETGEKIAYGIPTFTYRGNLIHFGGFKDHVSLFPGAAPVEVFKKEIKGYETSKGTIKFPLDKPLPLDLIKDIVKVCVERNLQKKSNN
jgi:uncharacterized protein YdhG (YjbR/CyaY superfamily)